MPQAYGATVQKVEVSIVADSAISPKVLSRLCNSVTAVGEHVFVGRDSDELAANTKAYEKIVTDVFDRVLVGYIVSDVTLKPGETTKLQVGIAPFGEVVRDVKIEVDFGGLSPEIAELVRHDLGDVSRALAAVLTGLPVDALDWAGGVSKAVVRDILQAQLPEFKANFEIVSGTETTVKISLIPQGTIVQNTKVNLRSRNIPNLLLLKAQPDAKQAALIMNGLPVAFVARHSDYFGERIGDVLKKHYLTDQYGLKFSVYIVAGVETQVELKATSEKLRVELEGYVDMGKKEDGTSVLLHVGKNISKTNELFTEAQFYTGTVSWRISQGLSHRLSNSLDVGYKYNITDKKGIWNLHKRLPGGWSLRMERCVANNETEYGVRYRIHDFLSAEYVFGEKENWLRVIGHL